MSECLFFLSVIVKESGEANLLCFCLWCQNIIVRWFLSVTSDTVVPTPWVKSCMCNFLCFVLLLFLRYGRVESVKVLRKRGSEGGVAAFVDFVDIKSAQKAHNAVNKMGDRDLRTDYNEPGSVPSAVRGLEDSSPSSSRDVTGFSRGTVGPVFGPPVSLHTREGRYERRIDG